MDEEGKEIIDDKHYSFAGVVFTGTQLKRLKDEYFAHPPTQEYFDKIWDEWEKKQNANLIRLDDTLRMKVEKNYVVVYDLFGKAGETNMFFLNEINANNLTFLGTNIKRQKQRGVRISKMTQ